MRTKSSLTINRKHIFWQYLIKTAVLRYTFIIISRASQWFLNIESTGMHCLQFVLEWAVMKIIPSIAQYSWLETSQFCGCVPAQSSLSGVDCHTHQWCMTWWAERAHPEQMQWPGSIVWNRCSAMTGTILLHQAIYQIFLNWIWQVRHH